MSNNSRIWLASYPRSGNTLLRTVLWQCFALRSASIYPNDLGGNAQLEQYVGHIAEDATGKVRFANNALPLFKTHEYPTDASPAIYVVRDGRAASVSLWQFYGRRAPLQAVMNGEHRFGSWSDHFTAWNPDNRPYTLLLRYEDIIGDLPGTLQKIAAFLNRKIVSTILPPREMVARDDGRWVRTKSDWQASMPAELRQEFELKNQAILSRLNYLP